MSLIRFIEKLWRDIREFFDDMPNDLQKAVKLGALIVENMKKAVESPTADIITQLIPGSVDDEVKARLREWLPKIFIQMKLAEECTGLTDPNEIVACGIRTLQQIEGDFNSAFLHDIAILIAQVAADGKLSWADGVYIMQWYYDHYGK